MKNNKKHQSILVKSLNELISLKNTTSSVFRYQDHELLHKDSVIAI